MAGLAIGLAFLSSFGLGTPAVVVWIGIVILLRARGSVGSVAAIAVLAAAMGGAFWADANRAELDVHLPPGGFEGVASVVDGPFLTQNGQWFIVRGAATHHQDVCVYADPSPRTHVGDQLFLVGTVTLPRDLSEIGRAALRARECVAQLGAEKTLVVTTGSGMRAWLSNVRISLSDSLMRAAPGDTGALLSGLVTGDDGGLSESAGSAFLSSGTTHITAISGANFAVLTLLLGVIATGAMRRSLWFVCVATSVIWLYAIMVGLQPSAVRAALLATAVLAGRWLGRIPDLLTLTLLLASLQIAFRPNDFDTLAFQLSIAATLALIVVFDGSERIRTRSWPASLALCVIAAQLATLPVLAARLGTLNGIGLLANLIIGPLASAAFPIALAGALLGQVMPALGEFVLTPAILIGDAMIWVVQWMNEMLPGTVQLGEPVPEAIAILAIVSWGAIFAMSGDLRRMGRQAWSTVRGW